MSFEWVVTILFAVVLVVLAIVRQSAAGWFDPVAVVLMIVAAVGLVASFLAAILLPLWLRRR